MTRRWKHAPSNVLVTGGTSSTSGASSRGGNCALCRQLPDLRDSGVSGNLSLGAWLLILRVDKCDVGQTDESQNVAQIGLLIVEAFGWRSRAKRAPARGHDIDFLAFQDPLRSG